MGRVGLIDINRAGIIPREYASDADVEAYQMIEKRAQIGIIRWIEGLQQVMPSFYVVIRVHYSLIWLDSSRESE